jgi:hypothetical protein
VLPVHECYTFQAPGTLQVLQLLLLIDLINGFNMYCSIVPNVFKKVDWVNLPQQFHDKIGKKKLMLGEFNPCCTFS